MLKNFKYRCKKKRERRKWQSRELNRRILLANFRFKMRLQGKRKSSRKRKIVEVACKGARSSLARLWASQKPQRNKWPKIHLLECLHKNSHHKSSNQRSFRADRKEWNNNMEITSKITCKCSQLINRDTKMMINKGTGAIRNSSSKIS